MISSARMLPPFSSAAIWLGVVWAAMSASAREVAATSRSWRLWRACTSRLTSMTTPRMIRSRVSNPTTMIVTRRCSDGVAVVMLAGTGGVMTVVVAGGSRYRGRSAEFVVRGLRVCVADR